MPAFQGLFAPYWNAEARGCVCLCVCLYVCYVHTSAEIGIGLVSRSQITSFPFEWISGEKVLV